LNCKITEVIDTIIKIIGKQLQAASCKLQAKYRDERQKGKKAKRQKGKKAKNFGRRKVAY